SITFLANTMSSTKTRSSTARTPRAQNASFNHAPTIRGYRGSIISGPVSRSATAFNFCIQGQIRLRRYLVIGSQGRVTFFGWRRRWCPRSDSRRARMPVIDRGRFATGANNRLRSMSPRRWVCQPTPWNRRPGFILRLVVLGVEDGNRIGPRRDSVEHAGRLSILDRCHGAAHFAARLAEAVGGGIEPAAHRPAVVAHAGDRDA